MSAKFSIRARIKSFGPALKGIFHVIRNEHNFQIHLFAAIVVVATGALMDLSQGEWLWIILAIAMVFIAETFNSAIEKLVDLKQPDFDKKAGLIKDISAGAVLIAAIAAVIIGLIIFIPKFF